MVDVVETIRSFNAGRDPQRLAMKYRNLLASPFVFLRGTCHLFYDRLPNEPLFHRAPLVWSCGDLHLENFGSYKGDNRLVYFDINDFDEATLAPATWDIVRLLASVLVAVDTLRATPGQALRLCMAFVQAYGDELTGGKARWVERETAQGLVRELLESLKGRSRVDFLDRRTERKRRRRVIRCDGRHALPASDAQRARVTELINEFASEQPDPAFFDVLDVARRIAGKRALPSALEPHLKINPPKWPTQAHRIMALQRRLQAVSMAFLHPIATEDVSYVLRGLQPSEDRVGLDAPNTGARADRRRAARDGMHAGLGSVAQLRPAGLGDRR